jgi:hypothetical protein
MVNNAVMMKAFLGIHAFQAVWSIVIMGVLGTGMLQSGPTSGAAKFMFALVSGGRAEIAERADGKTSSAG